MEKYSEQAYLGDDVGEEGVSEEREVLDDEVCGMQVNPICKVGSSTPRKRALKVNIVPSRQAWVRLPSSDRSRAPQNPSCGRCVSG
jgi:hypothetical protein